MMTPPTSSASANCHPIKTMSRIPSSITRLVEANSNAIAAEKSAPFRKIARASATAAYEHDDDAAPSAVAIDKERGESSGSSRLISDFDTTAWTTADKPNPRINAHSTSHVIDAERWSARTIAPPTVANAIIRSVERIG